MIGIISYADDPHKRVFRVVYPVNDDAELDQPPMLNGKVMLKDDGTPHDWGSFGTDGTRPRLIEKIANGLERLRLRGSPTTPKTEPVVYLVGLANLPDALAAQFDQWVAAGPTWLNIIALPDANLPTLVSPSWVVSIDTSLPSLGTPTRQRTFPNHTASLWVI